MTWICPWCRLPAQPVEVHGHVQCSRCRTNVDPCCGGAPPSEEDGADSRASREPESADREPG